MNAPVLSLWHGELLISRRPCHSPNDIVRDVAARHGLTFDEIRSKTRVRRVAWPRQEAMWELRQRTRLSLCQIAQRLGLKDHTGVLWGIAQHERRLAEGAIHAA